MGRQCIGVEIPPGPEGLAVLAASLGPALDGSALDGSALDGSALDGPGPAGSHPALALLPGAGPDEYRRRIRSAVRPGDPVASATALVVSTSGSTGDPAGVLLPAAALTWTARALAEHTGAPGGHRWVAALPLHHIGGAMVAVRAHVAGTVPVAVDSLGGARRFTVEGFARATEEASAASRVDARPLAVSLVPAMLALLDEAGADGLALLAAYDCVLVGGAAAPVALLARLREAGVRVRASYGMTETCGGVVIDGRPLPGALVQAGRNGHLRISSPQVGLGYRDRRHPQRWSVLPNGRRTFTTGDLGLVGPDGRVAVTGRSDDTVQVGGASVALASVRAVLLEDPRVADAAVLAVPDDAFGATLVAVVVPRRTTVDGPGAGRGDHDTSAAGRSRTALAEQLASQVEQALGRSARPRQIKLIAELPVAGSGKPDRAALAEIARQVLAQRRGRISP